MTTTKRKYTRKPKSEEKEAVKEEDKAENPENNPKVYVNSSKENVYTVKGRVSPGKKVTLLLEQANIKGLAIWDDK